MKNLSLELVFAFVFLLVPLSFFVTHLRAGLTPASTPMLSADPTIAPPPQAAQAGYTNLAFDDEFNTGVDIGYGSRGHKWNAGLWWEHVPSPSSFSISNGILTITGTAAINLCTQYHDHSGGTYFKGGYFEARMLCNDWSAFWLFCANRPRIHGKLVTPDPSTQTSEIDIIETDPGDRFVNTVITTVHKNTSSDGGIRDVQNRNNNNVIGSRVLGQWHTFGVLWTQSTLTWYVDDVEVCTAPSFPSTWQPMQLILTSAPRGVNGSGSTVIPPTTQVDWVRVWESSSDASPTPTAVPISTPTFPHG